MDFTDCVWYLIMQKGRTTSMELDEYLKNKNGRYKISISKQAFSKQRTLLSFANIFSLSGTVWDFHPLVVTHAGHTSEKDGVINYSALNRYLIPGLTSIMHY